jgi:ribosomal protein S18 acetylase RimI-like enzyme
MAQAFSIRGAAPGDWQGVLDCLRQAFEPYRQRYTDSAFADTVLTSATLRRRQTEMQILVAVEPANRVIGTIAFGVAHREGHVRGMAVLPEYQGCGVAAALLAQVEANLRGLNCLSVTLETTGPLARAMHFYEKSGFYRTAEVFSFFGMELLGYRKDL